jgi:hypothetical protein
MEIDKIWLLDISATAMLVGTVMLVPAISMIAQAKIVVMEVVKMRSMATRVFVKLDGKEHDVTKILTSVLALTVATETAKIL